MKKYSTHIIAIIIFIILPVVYFSPMLKGKTLEQSDVMHYKGMAREIVDYREKTGEETLWTNSMFSGMPAYLINMKQSYNVLRYIHKLVYSDNFRPACFVFVYLLGFYILLLLFGIDPRLAIPGALAYGFSTYFLVILVPGHLTKAMALGYMPMLIGSVYYTFRKDFFIGASLTAVFLGLQILSNHLQITYYTLLILLIFGVFELVQFIRLNKLSTLSKIAAALIVSVILAIGVNAVNIWSVYEYSPYSLRGPSELTTNKNQPEKTSGLDKDYATSWSYGIGETLNLFIPNFKGGSSSQLIADRDSKTFEYLMKNQGSQAAVQTINQNPYFFTQYWGKQPGTAGPVYIGAVVIFLFVFALFFYKGMLKWWLLSVVILSVFLAWGKNFMFLTDLFLDYFPGYNKFRTVSMTLVMSQLAIPLLAILALNRLFMGKYTKKELIDSLKWSLYITGGIAILFILAPSVSNLNASTDEYLIKQGAGGLVDALETDRANLLRNDAIRSLVFVLLSAGLLFLFHTKKIKKEYLVVLLSLLILIDLWPVDKRYINDDNFVSKRKTEVAFRPYQADVEILKDKAFHYRVFDLTPSDPFASSRASYFHHAVGGYHGAKMRRYQELYENQIREGNEKVLDMLNTKYLIVRDKNNGKPMPVLRNTNLGNSWFVSNYKVVENADNELAALSEIDPAKTAVLDKRFAHFVEGKSFSTDSVSSIELESYAPNKLTYNYIAKNDKLAVFSEIYYPKGWQAYINGKEQEHFRVDYVLRGMIVPKGKGTIEFVFKPAAYYKGNYVALASSILLMLSFIPGIMRKRRVKGNPEKQQLQ